MERGHNLAEFAKWLRIRLNNMQISPAELSRLTGIKDSTISRMLAGKTRPLAETLEKISPVIGVSLTDMLILSGYPLKVPASYEQLPDEAAAELIRDPDILLLARAYHALPMEKQDLVKKLILSMS
jgi:transcriptional regulator with XRE-family HTH domain